MKEKLNDYSPLFFAVPIRERLFQYNPFGSGTFMLATCKSLMDYAPEIMDYAPEIKEEIKRALKVKPISHEEILKIIEQNSAGKFLFLIQNGLISLSYEMIDKAFAEKRERIIASFLKLGTALSLSSDRFNTLFLKYDDVPEDVIHIFLLHMEQGVNFNYLGGPIQQLNNAMDKRKDNLTSALVKYIHEEDLYVNWTNLAYKAVIRLNSHFIKLLDQYQISIDLENDEDGHSLLSSLLTAARDKLLKPSWKNYLEPCQSTLNTLKRKGAQLNAMEKRRVLSYVKRTLQPEKLQGQLPYFLFLLDAYTYLSNIEYTKIIKKQKKKGTVDPIILNFK